MSTRGESSETRAVPQIVFRSSQAMLSTRGSSEFSCRDIAIIAQYFPIDFGKLRRANLHGRNGRIISSTSSGRLCWKCSLFFKKTETLSKLAK